MTRGTSHPVRDIGHAPVIVGAGVAGLIAALRLAPMPVVVLAEAPLKVEAASAWAQGGLAAAVGPDDDPARHLADTIATGAGLVDETVARLVTTAAPAAVAALRALGCAFDTDRKGALRLGLEAAHGRRRIVHAAGDGTGREIMRALAEAARATPSIRLLEGGSARRLVKVDNRIAGVLASAGGRPFFLPTTQVVIATGGLGGLYRHTTNPRGAIGSGLAMAALAGATLADMEFVQFHPTALDTGREPLALVSEAVRGEGAVLIDEKGERFMAGVPGAELAPRDVVARSVWAHMDAGHRTFLDARQSMGRHFAARFPAIDAACRSGGIDPARQPIPIRPAAHYHMGGIAVGATGRTSLDGLWACGEAAATGLHGANRLASNSLTEAVVFGRVVADDIAGLQASPHRRGVACPPLPPLPPLPPPADAAAVRPILTRCAGLLRSAGDLAAGLEGLLALVRKNGAAADPAIVAAMIVAAALRRRESRGSHFRVDAPSIDPAQAQRRYVRRDTLLHDLVIDRDLDQDQDQDSDQDSDPKLDFDACRTAALPAERIGA